MLENIRKFTYKNERSKSLSFFVVRYDSRDFVEILSKWLHEQEKWFMIKRYVMKKEI